MAAQVKLDPQLQEIVDGVQAAARERDELLDEPSGIAAIELSAAAKVAVRERPTGSVRASSVPIAVR